MDDEVQQVQRPRRELRLSPTRGFYFEYISEERREPRREQRQ